jgi:hypothetical protein
MDPQEKAYAIESPAPAAARVELPAPQHPAAAAAAPPFPAPGEELYLPFGSTDPDFHIPADCERGDRGFSRWLRALPLFGR